MRIRVNERRAAEGEDRFDRGNRQVARAYDELASREHDLYELQKEQAELVFGAMEGRIRDYFEKAGYRVEVLRQSGRSILVELRGTFGDVPVYIRLSYGYRNLALEALYRGDYLYGMHYNTVMVAGRFIPLVPDKRFTSRTPKDVQDGYRALMDTALGLEAVGAEIDGVPGVKALDAEIAQARKARDAVVVPTHPDLEPWVP